MLNSKARYFAVAALAAVALAACSSSSKGAGTATSPPTSPPTSAGETPTTSSATANPPTASTVSAANSKFGKILVDSKGMTLYVDENDKPGKPACTGGCLQAWPPLVAPATPTYGSGVTASQFTTVTLSDGTKQLAVKGFPLYTWTNDTKPGDVTGQGSGGFYAVQANGTKYDPGAKKAS